MTRNAQNERVEPAAQEQGIQTRNRPDHEIRLGELKAAIWKNETRYGVRYGMTFTRLYTAGENKWKSTSSFRTHDLPTLERLVAQAHAWLLEREAKQA